jgi:signal transduction histidine kinase/CheY-like chemotaxis protein
MSLRVKAALVIISIVLVFTAASFFLSFSFTRQKMTEAMEQDLALALAIGDDLVSTRTRLLIADADTVAERLLRILPGEDMRAVMAAQLNIYPEFIALAVINREGIVSYCGEPVDYGFSRYDNPYKQVAFAGNPIITTTYYSQPSGALVMYVVVPMGDNMVLTATIPGTIFADMVSGYRLWQTGNIFIIDAEGAFIASYCPVLVQERRNFIFGVQSDPGLESVSGFFKKMLAADHGAGTYFLNGVEHLCVFKLITGSGAGWRIAVVVPLNESPEANLRRGLLLSSLLFLLVGVLVSFFVSGIAVKPFYKIETQNRELAELNETIRAASEAKSKFLAKMSHEMRTPLNAIIGFSELSIAEKGLNVETLEKIYNAGAVLLNTVNDILDISKIEAGRFELVPAEYDTPNMISDTVTQSIMRKGEKSVEFVLEIDPNIPKRLYGDDLRVKQIFNNLLSNAFKYTNEGTVKFSVTSEPANDSIWLVASVTDTGIGISFQDMGRLFIEYGQVDIKLNHRIEGTGLGLSIAKMMAEMMGGSISVVSEYGKGSVFTARILQKIVSSEAIGPEIVNNIRNFRYSARRHDSTLWRSRIKLPNARVLIVDDVKTNFDVARGMMKPYGMLIDYVSGGQEAVDTVRSEKVRYNAIFMDHMMPGIDGIEATRIIREEIGTEYAKTVPIIALTANAIVGNEEMFLSKGFQAYIPKPIEIKLLDTVMERWVQNYNPEKPCAAQQIAGLDMVKGIERFSGDRETYMRVLQSFVTNTRILLGSVKVASEDNLPNYIISVHGIKGSCRGVCAEEAGTQAEALEKAAKDGDMDFVTANTPALIKTISELIAGIEKALCREFSNKDKPKKDRPDTEALAKLLTACENYKIDDVETLIKEMESFEYESYNELVLWLRQNAVEMNFSQMVERLKSLNI